MTEKKCPFALYFEADGYDVRRKELMGRQSAGNGFLRAAIAGMNPDTEYLLGYLSEQKTFDTLEYLVHQHAPSLEVRGVTFQETADLKQAGLLYLPDPNLPLAATKRLRGAITDFSITGVTHTTASHNALDSIRGLVTQPITPWDALICTSQSVKNTVDIVLEAELDYLSWRLGGKIQPQMCQTPIIPLGIHTKDFMFSEAQRVQARKNLELVDDEIVFLFLGRLTTFMKAHVYPMYAGLQAVAEQTNKKITLIECGWFANDYNREVMEEARRTVAPDVRHLHVEGREPGKKNDCWAGADVFVSLSDNIQETFGLTPVEAMACGLPILISDWDGYSELCDEGEEGFKIPTAMLDETEMYARNYEITEGYGRYCAGVAQVTSVDVECFIDKTKKLVLDPALRKSMGEKGRTRAREIYDWSVVYGRYQDLWRELTDIRQQAARDPDKFPINQNVPRVLPGRQAPSELFASYPSRYVKNDTRFMMTGDDTVQQYETLHQIGAFRPGHQTPPPFRDVKLVLNALQNNPDITPEEIAKKFKAQPFYVKKMLSTLLKMGLVKFRD